METGWRALATRWETHPVCLRRPRRSPLTCSPRLESCRPTWPPPSHLRPRPRRRPPPRPVALARPFASPTSLTRSRPSPLAPALLPLRSRAPTLGAPPHVATGLASLGRARSSGCGGRRSSDRRARLAHPGPKVPPCGGVAVAAAVPGAWLVAPSWVLPARHGAPHRVRRARPLGRHSLLPRRPQPHSRDARHFVPSSLCLDRLLGLLGALGLVSRRGGYGPHGVSLCPPPLPQPPPLPPRAPRSTDSCSSPGPRSSAIAALSPAGSPPPVPPRP